MFFKSVFVLLSTRSCVCESGVLWGLLLSLWSCEAPLDSQRVGLHKATGDINGASVRDSLRPAHTLDSSTGKEKKFQNRDCI